MYKNSFLFLRDNIEDFMYKKDHWKPISTVKSLLKRAKIIRKIRQFFLVRNILEVDTPILANFSVTDVNIQSFKTFFRDFSKVHKKKIFWLITSPEFHMKRLLSSGIGPIYQICKCFRNGEFGRIHNPEFSILEWYQPFYGMHQLIKEVDLFFQKVIKCRKAEKMSYKNTFMKFLSLDPFLVTKKELIDVINNYDLSNLLREKDTKGDLLEYLFMEKIQPYLGWKSPFFVYKYPIFLSGLSAVNKKNINVVDRFEVFFKGIEIGNGCHELINYSEQKKRFKRDNKVRKKKKLKKVKLDKLFLQSLLSKKIPICSGVAIGLDRLIMIALRKNNIKSVLSFNIENC